MTVTTSTYTTVTVVTPALQMDLALPSDVAVATLLPELLRWARIAGSGPAGWYLCRVGGPALGPETTLTEAGLTDGELLCLRPGPPPEFSPVFDDLPDAVAATAGTTGRWNAELTHRAGLTLAGCGFLVLAATLWREPAHSMAGPLGIGLGMLLPLVGHLFRRLGGNPDSAALLGAAALPLAVIGAVRATPDHDPVLMGSVALLATAMFSAALIAAARRVAAAGMTAGAIGAISTAVCSFLESQHLGTNGLVPAAAVAILLGGLLLPFAPRIANRLAHPADLDSRSAIVDLDRVAARTRAASDWLTGIAAGVGTVIGAAATVLAVHRGTGGTALAAAGLAVVVLHARTLRAAAPIFALLVPGLTGAVLAVAGVVLQGGADWRVLVPVSAAVVAAALLVPGRSFSPWTRRLVDIGHAVLLLALAPLTLAALDLFRIFRHL